MTDDDVECVAERLHQQERISMPWARIIARTAIAAMPSEAETIERCAKVADDTTRGIARGDFGLVGPAGIGRNIAAAIRALAVKTDGTK